MLEWFLQPVTLVSLGVAVILSVIYFWLCARKIFALNAEINAALNSEEISAALEKSELLKPTWQAFEKTLIQTNGETYSTIDAAEFFSPSNLTRNLNMTFWQGYGGIFTGLGILGTFGGLTFGLNGVDMTSGDIEMLKEGIKHLLEGVSTAFVTSIFGIGGGILYSAAHHGLLKNFSDNVQQLADKLDENFPRRSAENFLSNINATADEQKNFLSNINATADEQKNFLSNISATADDQKEILQNIGEKVAEAIYAGLDEKLGKYVEKICAAIDRIGAGGATAVGEIVGEIAGEQLKRFADALDRFSDSIDEKLKTANEISLLMNEQMLTTLKELREALQRHAEASAAANDAANEKFLATLAGLSNSLQEIADKFKQQQETSAADFAKLLKESLDNFSAVMAQIIADTKKAADEGREKDDQQRKNNAAANDAANEKFLATLADLSKTLQEIADKVNRQQTNAGDKFAALVAQLIADLKNFTELQKKIFERNANENAAQIFAAVKSFRELVDAHNSAVSKTFDQTRGILDESENYLQLMEDAADSLARTAEPVKQSTAQITRNLTETSAQMNTLAEANRLTRENLAALSTQINSLLTNYNKISGELENSIKFVADALENYNYEMSGGLQNALNEFDKNLKTAYSGLKEVVEELNESLEDFKRRR